MDKLYYIVCEEKGATLFEGRFQGRTRGGAIKFLKEQIGRPGLNGTVFTITEIPVPLIIEIVEAIMKGESVLTGSTPATVKPAEKVDLLYEIIQHQGRNAKQQNVTIERAQVKP